MLKMSLAQEGTDHKTCAESKIVALVGVKFMRDDVETVRD